jgi:hypothetical protein
MSSPLFDVIVRELRHAALAAALFVAIAPHIGAYGQDAADVPQKVFDDALNECPIDDLPARSRR